MDLTHDRASMIAEEEDRISKLPHDIIHRILSFLDMKYAIQTSTLSKKWKYIWTSMPYLNLNSQTSRNLPHFVKFVNDALSHRNHRTEVSAIELSFGGPATHFVIVVTSIVNYAYSHNVRQLSLVWFRLTKEVLQFPQRLFSCHTLKHLTLATHYLDRDGLSVPQSAWDFPVLETLNLSNLQLSDYRSKSLNLFYKCVNLKDLTLHKCCMHYLDIFYVCAPQLFNLTITDAYNFPEVLNMVAPKLENLTASISDIGSRILQLSTKDLNSLEKVNLSMRTHFPQKERYAPGIQDLFQKLCSTKFLILDKCIIEVLSACLDQLSYQPCPFNNLKCLKQKERMPTMPIKVRNYLLESSPTATFIMDLPQVPQKRSRDDVDKGTMAKVSNVIVSKVQQKRSRQEVDGCTTIKKVPHKRSRQEAENGTMANTLEEKEKQQTETVDEEKRMLEAKLFKQDEVVAEKKAMLEAMKLQHEKRMLEAKIHARDIIIAQQKLLHENAMLEAKLFKQDEVIAEKKAMLEAMKLQHEKRMLEAKIHARDIIIAQQKLLHENAMLEEKMHMQDKVIAEQKAMLETMKMQNEKKMLEAKILNQDKIIAQQKAMLEALKLQHEKIETELGNIDS